MTSPDKSREPEPETHEAGERAAAKPQPPSVETREGNIMQHALHALAAVPQNAPETAERIPSIQEQLELVCEVGRLLRMTAPSDREKIEYWKAYQKCIDDFRDAYAKLPPVGKIGATFKWRISDAMDRGDAGTLLKIFDEEKKEYAKPAWYKRMPGFNFLFGVGGGAVELGAGMAELGKQGVKAAMGDEHAREVLARVGRSLFELDKVAATLFRSDEYKTSIAQGGETTGYVLGKHAFDIASSLVSGGAGGALGKGVNIASHGAREAVHTAGHVTGHALGEAVHVAAHEAEHGTEHAEAPAPTAKKML